MKYIKISFKTGHGAIYNTMDEKTYYLVRFIDIEADNRFWPPTTSRSHIYDYIKTDGDVVVDLTEKQVEEEAFLAQI